MSLEKRPVKHKRTQHKKIKHKKFIKDKNPKRTQKPKVYDVRTESLTPHLFEANERDLREAVRQIDSKLKVTKKKKQRKRLQHHRTIVRARLRDMGINPDAITRADILNYDIKL